MAATAAYRAGAFMGRHSLQSAAPDSRPQSGMDEHQNRADDARRRRDGGNDDFGPRRFLPGGIACEYLGHRAVEYQRSSYRAGSGLGDACVSA